MKMNEKMSGLLKDAGFPIPFDASISSDSPKELTFVTVGDSVLLKDEYNGAQHTKPTDFPDRTGYECFVNHIHLQFDGSRESLLSCLKYAVALQRQLARLPIHRRFQVIVALSEQGCTVRFHEVRPSENWVAEDLEGYSHEAVLLLLA